MNNLEKQYSQLRKELDNMDVKNESYNALQTKVFNLLSVLREENTPMEPRNYIPPSQYDVLLTDVGHNDLVGNISQRLSVSYLSEGKPGCQESVKGILYGTNARPMINLVVSSKVYRKSINVIFLIDTGSPALYVSQLAMEALGFTENIPATFDLSYGGKTHEAVMSPQKVDGKDGHYKDINLIGATFLTKMGAKLIVDYGENEVTLTFN